MNGRCKLIFETRLYHIMTSRRKSHTTGLLIGLAMFAFFATSCEQPSWCDEDISQPKVLENKPSDFLQNDIIYRVSFDAKNPRPDIGELEVKKTGNNLEYAPGIMGQALVLSGRPTPSVEYQPARPLFRDSGSISFWVMPQTWIARSAAKARGIIVFLRAAIAGGAMIIERQGFSANPKRMDCLLILLNKVTEGTPLAVADATEQWKNGTWHLVVINWDEKGFEVSVDGKELKRTNYPRALATSDFTGQEQFAVGGYANADTPEQTLLDEITVFKRPLSLLEIRKVYKTGSANITSDALLARETPTEPAAALPVASPGASWNMNVIKTEARLPFITRAEAPKIDGVIGEEEWGGALKQFGGYKNDFYLEQRECAYYLSSDGEKIYIAIRSELPPTKKLLAVNPPLGDQDVPQACNDDSVEIWVMPDKNAGGDMFAAIINSLGAVYDFAYDSQSKKMKESWQSKVEFAGKMVGDEWHAEIAIPASSLGRAAIEENLPYGIHIVRNFKRPGMQANWTPNIGAFNNPDNMGAVTWDNKAPLVRFVSALSADK